MIRFNLKQQRQVEWAHNEHTQHYAAEARKDLVPKALTKLMGVCRNSQDPHVREALKEYECLRAFMEMLEGKHEGNDGRR